MAQGNKQLQKWWDTFILLQENLKKILLFNDYTGRHFFSTKMLLGNGHMFLG